MGILTDAVSVHQLWNEEDSHLDGLDFTDVGSPTYDDGYVTLDGTSDYLTQVIGVGSGYNIGSSDWAMSLKFRYHSGDTGSNVYVAGLANLDWRITKTNGERIKFDVGGLGSAEVVGPYSSDTWYHTLVWFEASTQTIGIRINDTDEDTTLISADGLDRTTSFNIGNASASAFTLDGDIGDVRVRKGSLWTSAEITALYNSGELLPYYADGTEVFLEGDHLLDTRGQAFAQFTESGGVTHVSGLVGDAFDFSGSSQRIETSSKYFKWLTARSFHMVAWVRLDAVGATQGLFGQATGSYHCHVLSSNKVRFQAVSTASTNNRLDSTATLSVDTWTRISCGYDAVEDEIFLQINEGTKEVIDMSGEDITPLASSFHMGAITTSQYLNGKIDQFKMKIGCLYTTSELSDHYNSGSGAAEETEIQLDYNFSGSTARRVKVQAKAAEIGGSGTHTSQLLYITEGQLPDELHDTDETATVAASGAPSLRISTSESGAGQVPLYKYKFVPASSGGDVKIFFNSGDVDMDGTSGTDVYVWWFPSGSNKLTYPAGSAFGANRVVQSNPMLAVLGDSYEDLSGNDNTAGTTTAPTTASSQLGDNSYDFDGTGDRITFPDDNSLDADTMVSFALWVKFDNVDTGTWQSIFSKRQGFDVNYGLHFNPTDNSMQLYFYQSSDWRSLHIDLRTYVGDTNWHHIAGKLVEDGSDVDTQLWVDGVSAGSSTISSITLPVNTREFNLGISKTGTSTYGDEFEGQIDSPIFFNYDISSDEVLTLYNNQDDPESFWDHTFAVTSPGVTDKVSTYHGAANITVQHKLGLASILSYEEGAIGSTTNKLGLKSQIAYEAGVEGSLTHSLGLAATVVASHNAGANFSTQHKTGRVSIVAVQEGITVSDTYVSGRVAIVTHEGDITYSNIHITGRQARSNHEIGAIYSALTVEINDPVSLSLSIEHLNKITLTIEKVS